MPRPPRGKNPASPEDDATLLVALVGLLAVVKTVSVPIEWVDDEAGDLRFTRALDIDGVTETGCFLFGRAVASLPDRHVTLGLRWSDATGRGVHFDRLDWKPMDAHNNKGMGPRGWRHVLIDGTHHHRLADNAALSIGLTEALRQNLPVAVPVEPDPGWQDFLAEAARRWCMPALVNMPEPPWQYDLLTFPNIPRGNRGQGRTS